MRFWWQSQNRRVGDLAAIVASTSTDFRLLSTIQINFTCAVSETNIQQCPQFFLVSDIYRIDVLELWVLWNIKL